MRRPTRPRRTRGRSMVGTRFTAVVGPIAHGGHCVTRVEVPGQDRPRVVFTRHALPGERVVLVITEGGERDSFWRGDAVEVLDPSPDRVSPPCRYAGPDGCGGCDFQHVALPAQRELKASVIREQLVRLAGLAAGDPLLTGLVVEQVPGDVGGLRWRTRQRYVPLGSADGTPRRGMRKHRSHEVIEIEECLLAAPHAREPRPGTVRERVEPSTAAGHDFEVAADGFWQVHPGAPAALVGAVLEGLDPRPGDRVLDLYAGVGLFSAFLADRVGPDGTVTAVEGDRTASSYAARNVPAARVYGGEVAGVLAAAPASTPADPVDLVVLDPPREGAGGAVVRAVAARAPRAVAYVACDPAALARDLATFAELGYRPTSLRAFDLFPMTHHVECVALLTKTGSDLR
ncbi:MAG: methyltransferase [Nocardioides sp.]|uniref:class I SAM-dependent RNA methyltransferase n=1 Tax=Nocardioides sp. TaxID=35761 RepID=UPI0039E2DCD6